MSTQNFNFNFDLDKMGNRMSFQSMQKSVNFELALERGLKNGHKEVADGMLDKVIEQLSSFGLNDSDIFNEINILILDDGISMRLDDEYAVFVEYGTGVVGEQNPHPKPSRNNWMYDINEHGEEGWWYPSTDSDPNPTKYLAENGWWAWTRGQSSRPFMYNTWLWTSRRATQIIDKHIKIEFKKLERIAK